MKKIIINENQRGFLFKNEKYVKMLTAGKYYVWYNISIVKNCELAVQNYAYFCYNERVME